MDNAKFNQWYKDTPYFKYYNANPSSKGRKGWMWDKCDCVIRALSKSINCEWLEAYDFLSSMARRDFNVPNDGKALRGWLKENGAIWVACKAIKGQKRMTCEEFALSHKCGRYIISIAKHETACVDGVIYDTWNCGGKAVVGYYDMSNFKIK